MGSPSASIRLLLATVTPKTWMSDAACRHEDPELFFPREAYNRSAKEAKRVCDSCSVAGDCYLYAVTLISSGARLEGIWGGRNMNRVTPRQATLIIEQQQRGRQSAEQAQRHRER